MNTTQLTTSKEDTTVPHIIRTHWDDHVTSQLLKAIQEHNKPEIKRWYHSLSVSLKEKLFDHWTADEVYLMIICRLMLDDDRKLFTMMLQKVEIR